MWYYEFEGQSIGPVNKGAIKKALLSGKINAGTLICSAGTTQWIKLEESELNTLIQETSSILSTIDVQEDRSRTESLQRSIPVYAKELDRLGWWCVGIIAFAIIGNGILLIKLNYVSLIYFILVNFPLVLVVIPKFMLLSKFWKALQAGDAETSPGRAVGFLFIPFFNFYWLYKAYFNLATGLNKFTEQYLSKGFRKAHEWLALVYCILCSIWAAFWVYQVFGSFTRSYYDRWPFSIYKNPVRIVALVLFGVQLLIQIPMFIDLFLTVKSIVKNTDQSGSSVPAM